MTGNKERQRLFRLRRDADPERRSKYLAEKRHKYQQDVSTGRRRKISDITEREKRSQRKAWRNRQKSSRERRQQPVNLDTPPISPSDNGAAPPANSSSQRRRGRPRVAHRKEKCFQTIRKLEAQLRDEKRRTERYRKKYQRIVNKQQSSKATPSPGSRTRNLLRYLNPGRPNKKVKKTLTFHFSLLDDIKRRFKESKTERQRQSFCRFLSGKIMKKYRMRKFAEQELGLSSRRWYNGNTFEYTPVCRIKRVHTPVLQFYLRDDNSRIITGKKNTKTANKIKRQRRVLQDTLKNLHRKYESENHPKVSYATFCRLRPFWVTEPRDIDRETCLCKNHENMQFLAQKLHNLGLIKTADVETLARDIVCDEQKKDCFYDDCQSCKITAYPGLSPLPDRRDSEDVKYFQWVTKKVSNTDAKGSVKDFSIVAKEEIVTSLSELVDKFQDSLHNFKKHVFNIKNQFSSYRHIRENLNDESCLVHIDFSENYCGKYQQEIQSVHFGGSHKQMSLHTGVLYLKDEMLSFCSISPSTQHDPPAIWAHLSPILNLLRENHPQVKTIHFFSDGPCTQYRQKINFYCLCTIPFDMGFQTISWNFFESSHGKGAPDDIGGFLKRTADRQVKLGKDIPSAEVLIDVLQSAQSSVKLYYISDEMISLMVQKLSNMTFPTIKGTMRLHQVISTERGVIAYRDISCICSMTDGVLNCACYDLKQFSFHAPKSTSITHLTEAQATHKDQSTSEDQNHTTTLSRPEVLDLSHVGQHCVVVYDDRPYPGVILDVDGDDVEVKCMASLGKNRFFWPTIREDINVYSQSDILCLTKEPERSDRRAWQLEKAVWLQIEKALDLA